MTKQTGNPRLAVRDDIPPLKALWKTVFGDSDADIDHFFETYFSPDMVTVMDDGGKIVSAAYIMPVGDLVLPQLKHDIFQIGGSQIEPGHSAERRYGSQDSADKRYPVAMLYAIATHPDARGHGYGEAVTRAAYNQAVKKGCPAVVLKPADAGLFDFYGKRTDFRDFFDAYEADWTAAALPPPDSQYKMMPVSPAEYRNIRRGLLAGCAYIDSDERALSYQQYLCQKAGGGLVALARNDRIIACAIIEPDDGTIHLKELLYADGCNPADAAAAIARTIPGERYVVRTPKGCVNWKFRRFGMLVPLTECPNVPYVYSAKWYGPAFD